MHDGINPDCSFTLFIPIELFFYDTGVLQVASLKVAPPSHPIFGEQLMKRRAVVKGITNQNSTSNQQFAPSYTFAQSGFGLKTASMYIPYSTSLSIDNTNQRDENHGTSWTYQLKVLQDGLAN